MSNTFIVSLVEHHSVIVSAHTAEKAKEKVEAMWRHGDLQLNETTFVEMEITDAQRQEEACNDCDLGLTEYPTYDRDGKTYCSWCDREK